MPGNGIYTWRSQLARITLNLSVVLISAVIGFLAIEGLLRLYIDFDADDKNAEGGYIQKLEGSQRIYGLKPNLGGHLHTNSYGFRGQEFSRQKDPSVYRIIMLGDSVTFGNGIAWNKTFSYRLEQSLNRLHSKCTFEVYNLGISGYNSQQELATLKEVGISFSPDLALLNVCLNDSDFKKKVTTAGLRNTTSITDVRDLNIRTIINTSYLLTYIKVTLQDLIDRDNFFMKFINSPDLVINPRVREPRWASMKQTIRHIADTALAHGIEFGTVIYPYRSQLDEPPEHLRPQHDLREFFDGERIKTLDLIDYYRDSSSDMFNDGHLHLSSHGHAVVSDAILEFLIRSSFFEECSLMEADVGDPRYSRR